MVDVFEEVEEQLRSDRYRTLARKGWPYVAGLALVALVIFGGVWGYRYYQDTKSAKASEAYEAASELGTKGDVAGAEKAFRDVAKTGSPAYRSLALMQVAGLRVDAGKPDEAVALLDEAAELAPHPLIGDGAKLKAAYLLLDTASVADLRKRLDPLTEAGRPYAALAREAVAMKLLAAGQVKEARAAFSALALLPDATDQARDRATAAMALIDSGAYATANQAASAAAKLPKLVPPPQLGELQPMPAPTPAPAGAAAQ